MDDNTDLAPFAKRAKSLARPERKRFSGENTAFENTTNDTKKAAMRDLIEAK